MRLVSRMYDWMSTTLKGRFFTGIAFLILFGGLLSILPLLIFVQEQREEDALLNLNGVLHMQSELLSEWQDELIRDINTQRFIQYISGFHEKYRLVSRCAST